MIIIVITFLIIIIIIIVIIILIDKIMIVITFLIIIIVIIIVSLYSKGCFIWKFAFTHYGCKQSTDIPPLTGRYGRKGEQRDG